MDNYTTLSQRQANTTATASPNGLSLSLSLSLPHLFMALGFQYTKYGCRKKGDTRMVHRGYCDVSKKPKPIRRMCNLQDCTHPQ